MHIKNFTAALNDANVLPFETLCLLQMMPIYHQARPHHTLLHSNRLRKPTHTFGCHNTHAFSQRHHLAFLHLQQHFQPVYWCCGCPAECTSKSCKLRIGLTKGSNQRQQGGTRHAVSSADDVGTQNWAANAELLLCSPSSKHTESPPATVQSGADVRRVRLLTQQHVTTSC
eukprot:GHRQ01006838.1.p1 GENE.GHRQ01006838.1~~GHRQ01006838.1.p1  ORF type:complete len:171 (-),score=25.32 GHRQ01006838.1:554-1066(-)